MVHDSIVVALISGGLAFLGTVLSNITTHSKTMYRIEQLEKKQDIHNGVIDRVYGLEKTVCILDEREKALDDRIEVLENK